MENSKTVSLFARPPFAKEILRSKEQQQKFDDLAGWQRHFIDRLIEHGNLPLAAREANCSTQVKKYVDGEGAETQNIREALNSCGLTTGRLIAELKAVLDAKGMKFDRHGNPIPAVDLRLKKSALEMIFKLRGDFTEQKDPRSSQPEHIEELFGKDVDV